MLAPSFCLCLAVPLYPSLGERLCPELTAELGPGGITAESGVLWWDPRESTAPGTAHGNSHTSGLGLGSGRGWQLPGIQSSQFCLWRFMGRRPGSLAFARVPWHQNTCRRDGKNPRASEGKEVESPDSWGGSAVSVSPRQVAALQEPRACQPGMSPAGSNPTCMAIGARGAMVGNSALPCMPHRVLWAKPVQGNSL